ncbi:uncharacterized protein I303_102165 [Kwoniella dejecticola CBS 10117]|uniref:Protein OS-9 homolog n=1 Tax=Kwoniella dejecticola CBS 10117 TaxID=1296121 RepID=A0A1A6ABQ3_9TREE|nr:uncharacterized protein I303_01695 [Kwoniella dejecticola CBS 10117]OBR87489.1 hypothetical protein I303_01695 [Kwoniella dejecticola CBS 10117]
MSRNLLIYLCALSSLSSTSSLRQGGNQLRDLYAYPKYEVQFLNDLPLSQSDAERVKSLGLGNEQDWLQGNLGGSSGRRLSDGNEEAAIKDSLEVIPMNFAHPSEEAGSVPYPYLCLMPSKNATDTQTAMIDSLDQVVESEDELDPIQGWQAMSHLDGKCLFTKQGWFTYSYCHNSHIRQFHAAPHPHPHPPGGLVPVEDTKYDAYTLGQVSPGSRQRFAAGQHRVGGGVDAEKIRGKSNTNAAGSESQSESGSEIDSLSTSASTSSKKSNQPTISFGSNQSSSRYLIQRWSYGTRCDKTGKPREVEVQIHCSMTTGDMIYMIKELSICQYVIIIHSPYLCSLPGFKNHQENMVNKIENAPIRCRQVVDDEEFQKWENEQSLKKQNQASEDTLNGNILELDGTIGRGDIRGKESLYSKRPTGADVPPSELGIDQQGIKHHFGLKGPEQMFGTEQAHEGEELEIVFEGSDVDDESLRKMLKQALELLGKNTLPQDKGVESEQEGQATDQDEGEGEGEQVIFYTWEEGDEGPVLVDADLVILDETETAEQDEVPEKEKQEKARVELGKKEKSVLQQVVRNFLQQKGKAERSSDENEEEKTTTKKKKKQQRKDEL